VGTVNYIHFDRPLLVLFKPKDVGRRGAPQLVRGHLERVAHLAGRSQKLAEAEPVSWGDSWRHHLALSKNTPTE